MGGHGRSHGRKRPESIGGQDPLERQQPPHHGSFAVVVGVPESPRPVGRQVHSPGVQRHRLFAGLSCKSVADSLATTPPIADAESKSECG